MNRRVVLEREMESCALIGKCLADSTAVRIIAILFDHEFFLDELESILQLPERKIQASLDRLRHAGLVVSERKGRRMSHRLNETRLKMLTAIFEALEDDIEWDMQLTVAKKRLPLVLKRRSS